MSWLSSFIGDLTGRNATNAAVNAQNESTDRSIEFLREMYYDGVNRQQPWDDARMSFMGITPNPTNALALPAGSQGAPDYAAYGANNADVQNAFSGLSGRDISGILRMDDGRFDVNGDGQLSQNEYYGFQYDQYGQGEGRDLPLIGGGTAGQPQTADAGGGFDYTNNPLYTSMMNTTEADFKRITDAAGAGGNVLSGNYLTALNDQNRRNENAAVGQVWNALNGGFVGAQNQAQQGNALASNVANLETQRGASNASSYFQQGMNNQNLLARGIGAAAGAWF